MNWLQYFEDNRKNRMEIPWGAVSGLAQAYRQPLGRSIQRFQIGESGEGEHIKCVAAKEPNPEYARSVACFIAEEQEHARLMGLLLDELDMPRLKWHWSEKCFVGLRRGAGLRMELLFILIAEMIAKRYFRMLAEAIDNEGVQMMARQILRDELGHIAFHTDTLHAGFAHWGAPGRRLLRASWKAAYRCVCLVVYLDHRALLTVCGVPFVEYWRDCMAVFDETADAIFALTDGRPALELMR